LNNIVTLKSGVTRDVTRFAATHERDKRTEGRTNNARPQ